MGTKVQFDNHLPGLCSMRDLNHESDGTRWALFYGENNLPNRQYYYGLLPRPAADSSPDAHKDTLKQTILKHEAVFKDQVIELHRLYRVQKDLMGEIHKQEQYKHRIPYEAASSSSVFPLQMTPEDAHQRNSSNFIFANSSGGSPVQGKCVQASSIPLHKCGSPRHSEVSESRPKKLRIMIDLELPADEYVDPDEVEQQSSGHVFNRVESLFPSHLGKSECKKDASGLDSSSRKPSALADLNEPALSEETNVNPSVNIYPWNSNKGNMNGTISCSQYDDEGNGRHWLPMVKEGIKDDLRSIPKTDHVGKESMSYSPAQKLQQPGFLSPQPHLNNGDMCPAKANVGFKMSDRSQGAPLSSQLPSSVPSADLANSWGHSCEMPNSRLSQKSLPAQSLVQSNECLGNRWHMVNQKQFYKAARGYVNTGYVDKGTSGSSNFLSGIDLNAALRNGQSNEPLATQGVKNVDCKVKQEVPLSALPWLRPKVGASSATEAASRRSGSNKAESCLFHTADELLNRGEFGNMLGCQNSVVSSSCNVVDAAGAKDCVILDHPSSSRKILEVPISLKPSSGEDEMESGRRKRLLDINLPCDDPDFPEAVEAAVVSEIIVREKTVNANSSSIRNMFDLNSCVMEDETCLTNSSATAISVELDERTIILDLEAPINLEAEEDELLHPLQGAIDSGDEELARVAAEAIVSISSCTGTTGPQSLQEASGSEDALQWFADIVCSAPDDAKSCLDDNDCLSCESDYLEEMTLKLTECTVDEYFPSPTVPDIPAVEEPSPSTVMGRVRRGPTRKGRQRRDFQKDILPGLTSLGRNEVTEDLQTFGGLMRATGHAWNSGTRRNTSRNRSGRGRRRAVVAIPPPSPPPVASLTVETPVFGSQKSGEIMLEDRSLSSWGKVTRRPRRQRCPSATSGNLTSAVFT